MAEMGLKSLVARAFDGHQGARPVDSSAYWGHQFKEPRTRPVPWAAGLTVAAAFATRRHGAAPPQLSREANARDSGSA